MSTASRTPRAALTSDLRAASRLVIEGVTGVTDVVESMHRTISGLAPALGAPRRGRTRGVTGLVYRSVRGVARVVGSGLDLALRQLAPMLGGRGEGPRREAAVAALNGVLGDHLDATGNALALPMRMRRQGRTLVLEQQALRAEFSRPSDKLVVLVHGLCMNDLQWARDGHDHGASLARDLGYSPVYLHYNSGLPVSANGRQFAELLERLVGEWPVPVRELAVVGFSMGGLVARSACHYGRLAQHDWPSRLGRLVFLGTPHHGTLWEHAGSWVDVLLAISPYSAPIARLSGVRSAGIRDLRSGNVVDSDGDVGGVPLPEGIQCFAIAASRQERPGPDGGRTRGDGLVGVNSALGEHRDPTRSLAIPESRRSRFHGLKHVDLLGSRDVYDRIQSWLA